MIRIVGIGGPFGDDGAGLEAARRLANDPPPETEVVFADRPGIALVDLLPDAEALILIDSVRSARPPGTIHDLDLAEVARRAGRSLTSHDASLPEALALADALGRLARGRFLGVEIGEPAGVSDATGLTAAVENGLRQLTIKARRWVTVLGRQPLAGERSSFRRA